MLLAEVIGSAVCTITVESINNKKFKLVRLIKPDNKLAGSYSIVEDLIGTGFGDKVLIAEDEIALGEMYNGKEDIPIRFCIIAKVDSINLIK